jgi:hypothetical protein
MRGVYGELKVENGLDLDAVAILSSSEAPQTPLLAVYIQSNDSYRMKGIKDGTYILYCALGKDWDNYSKRFTSETTYERFEQELRFTSSETTYTIYEITLHPVIGGTGRTKPVSEDEFPELV